MMINTDGADMARLAAKFALGLTTGPLSLHAASETVSLEKSPNMSYVHFSMVLLI
jgi:hypothetical protein